MSASGFTDEDGVRWEPDPTGRFRFRGVETDGTWSDRVCNGPGQATTVNTIDTARFPPGTLPPPPEVTGPAGSSPRWRGWHPDPSGRHERRWWDGEAWSGAVRDGKVRANDPDGFSGRPPSGGGLTTSQVLAILGILGFWTCLPFAPMAVVAGITHRREADKAGDDATYAKDTFGIYVGILGTLLWAWFLWSMMNASIWQTGI